MNNLIVKYLQMLRIILIIGINIVNFNLMSEINIILQ